MRYGLVSGLLVVVCVGVLFARRGRTPAASPDGAARCCLPSAGTGSTDETDERAAGARSAAPNPLKRSWASGLANAAADEPVVCTLSEVDRAGRVVEFRTVLARLIDETVERHNGYAFRFAAKDDLLRELTAWMSFERKCCRFMRFRLTVEPCEGPLWLEITGPAGTKAMLAALLESAD